MEQMLEVGPSLSTFLLTFQQWRHRIRLRIRFLTSNSHPREEVAAPGRDSGCFHDPKKTRQLGSFPRLFHRIDRKNSSERRKDE
jgi:hypothetical protein